jgi:gliding motility-associated lipoprotein GldH
MKKSKHLVSIIIFLALAFTFSSCDRGPVFEKYIKMKNFIWDRFDIKMFELPIEDASSKYDIKFVARCVEQFPYDNLQFYVILTSPSGEERMREVTIPVRNNGKMIGEPTGKIYENSIVLWKEISFTDKGTCKISIENLIPKIQTEGIDEIGIVVTKAK